MKIYIGTSGWKYFWNPDGLKWYVENTPFNAIELNMSFYSFPRQRQVERWEREGNDLRWVVKVHRSITHMRKMSLKSIATWKKFREVFSPLEQKIDLYLFQFPPSLAFSEKIFERIISYYREGEIGEKMAIEPRHESWFNEKVEEKFAEHDILMVTPDSPMFNGLPQNKLFKTTDKVYLRIHGRTEWYSHIYSSEELEELVEKILETKTTKAYIFLNNDHGMLPNGEELVKIFTRRGYPVTRE
ncbi:MAG: DUF72 domain-containing protein [Thermoproteales archaeon]|nr:DUF72 domain-containing protein [Thermoproteales archaeon]